MSHSHLNRLALSFLSAAVISACAGGGDPTKNAYKPEDVGTTKLGDGQASSQGQAKEEKSVSMTYFNSTAFDSELSEAMNKGSREINVQISIPFSLNNVPERLDAWLSSIKDNGGRVQAQTENPDEQVATRGSIADAIDYAGKIYDYAKKKMLYSPAKQYSAILFYDKGNGNVGKLVLYRRQ